MSQQETVCSNKVQVELKEELELCSDKEFLCRNTTEEVCEKDCRDTLDSVATLIKVNGSGTLSRKSLLCCNIKE